MLKTAFLFSSLSILSSFPNLSFDVSQISSDKFNNQNYIYSLPVIIVQKTAPRRVTYPTIEMEGFLFQYKGCKSSQYNLMKCDLVVTNKQKRRELTIRSKTRIIDNAGNELVASELSLGSEKGTSYARNDLSTNIPIKASVTFRGAIGSNIILFDINAYAQERGDFNVEFKQE